MKCSEYKVFKNSTCEKNRVCPHCFGVGIVYIQADMDGCSREYFCKCSAGQELERKQGVLRKWIEWY